MSPETLNELLKRQPFRPLRSERSNPETAGARNPSLVVVMKHEIFVADSSRDHFHLYALMHVVGVESLPAA